MTILFVHGWAWDERLWQLVDSLWHDDTVNHINLGFSGAPQWHERTTHKTVAVGHSLGFLWLLMQPVVYDGYVSINGFSHFVTSDTKAALRAMRQRLQTSPQQTVANFHRACGASSMPHCRYNWQRLDEGLHWLATWDGRKPLEQLHKSHVPIVSLAGRRDAIVPAQCTIEPVRWCDDGNHLLPVTHPHDCAAAIRDCISHVGS